MARMRNLPGAKCSDRVGKPIEDSESGKVDRIEKVLLV
jgi:hypothetical protein